MPKHKNKAAPPNPDSSPNLINRYLFPVTIGVLLLAVAAIGPWLSQVHGTVAGVLGAPSDEVGDRPHRIIDADPSQALDR